MQNNFILLLMLNLQLYSKTIKIYANTDFLNDTGNGLPLSQFNAVSAIHHALIAL